MYIFFFSFSDQNVDEEFYREDSEVRQLAEDCERAERIARAAEQRAAFQKKAAEAAIAKAKIQEEEFARVRSEVDELLEERYCLHVV